MSATSQSNTFAAECPECEAEITFSRRPLLGEVTQCTDCGAELEVIRREPVTLELAPEVEEDWGE